MGTKVPGRTHPTLVKEAKGFSVVVVVVVIFIGADYLIRWATFGHNFLRKSGEVAFFRGELQE
jgi:citrate lyase synthetase